MYSAENYAPDDNPLIRTGDILLDLPEDFTPEWHEFFVRNFLGRHTSIPTSFCIREMSDGNFVSTDVYDFTEALDGVIGGDIVGIKMVPDVSPYTVFDRDYFEEFGDLEYEPYLALNSVQNNGRPLTRSRERQVWIPLGNLQNLLIYGPQESEQQSSATDLNH